MISEKEIITWALDKHDDVYLKHTYGESSLFYNPNHLFKNGVYFLTLKNNDGPNDKSSKLEREGIYRLSFSIPKENYEIDFGETPIRAKKGKTIDLDYDFSELNRLMPHAVYGWINWLMVLSPSDDVFESCQQYIEMSYQKAISSFNKKSKKILQNL